jgi:Chaperone of endosialidase
MKKLLLSLLVLFCLPDTYAQIGIKANGTAPISSAQLEVQSTTKAFYPPRMTTAQKNAIAGVVAGAMVFDTDLGGLFTYNGSVWVAGSGLTLPYSTVQNQAATLFNIENSNTNNWDVIRSSTNSLGGGTAVKGIAANVVPTSTTAGVSGLNYSTNGQGAGVFGGHSGTGFGVWGNSNNGSGVFATTNSGNGIFGSSTTGNAAYLSSSSGYALWTSGKVRLGGGGVGTFGTGKFLKSINSSGDAEWSDLLPITNSQSSIVPIIDITNTNTGGYDAVVFNTNSTASGSALVGSAINTTPGSNSRGVTGANLSTNNLGSGVYGFHAGTGSAVAGYSAYGKGVKGTTDYGYGVYGESLSGTTGVYGKSTSGYGVSGYSPSGFGVYGDSNTGVGVYGTSNYVGGYFSSYTSSGSALFTDIGKVGLGTSAPNLNADERVDINGRLRIRGNGSTAGVWFNNAANSIAYTDGAFSGMKNDTEVGLFIGGTWRFWVNNVGNGYLNGNLIQTSDRRLKKDFSLLNNSLSDIYQLKGYHYKWIEASKSQDLQTGLIAQEVQKIFPELVQTDEKGFLSVNYIGLIPHLIEAVKELRNENNDLKELRNENKDLRNRLGKIEEILSVSASKK